MKFMMALALATVFVTSGWAQTSETEQLKLKIAAQGQEIDALHQQLARIERLLAGGTAPEQPRVTPAAFVQPPAPVQSVPARIAPADASKVSPAGFRFGADFRLRFDASLRKASSTT